MQCVTFWFNNGYAKWDYEKKKKNAIYGHISIRLSPVPFDWGVMNEACHIYLKCEWVSWFSHCLALLNHFYMPLLS